MATRHTTTLQDLRTLLEDGYRLEDVSSTQDALILEIADDRDRRTVHLGPAAACRLVQGPLLDRLVATYRARDGSDLLHLIA